MNPPACDTAGSSTMENKFLRFFAAGNLSFTGIVNHTRQDLRHGKNAAERQAQNTEKCLGSLSWVCSSVALITFVTDSISNSTM